MGPSRDTYACSLCSVRVPRELAHRNRAGAYICHVCQAERNNAGIFVRLQKRLHRRLYKLSGTTAFVTGSLLVALAVAILIVQLFN